MKAIYKLKIDFISSESGLSEITETSLHYFKFTRWWKKFFTVGYNTTITTPTKITKYSLDPDFTQQDL